MIRGEKFKTALYKIISTVMFDNLFCIHVAVLFSRNKQRSKDIKHFTTASEIKAYQGHLPKHKPQEMITQYACNKPAS